ncbi:MAG: type II toxin-antitoxin system HicB family antitoxin [Mariniphaga sp.]
MNYLNYKGYTGSIEYNREDDLLFGKVLGINGLISYEGKTGKELELDFKQAIEEYLSTCKENEIIPEKPFKGNFNIRISAELHQKAALLAMKDQISLNSFVAESIREKVLRESDAESLKQK